KRLFFLGVLTELDGVALEALCEAYADGQEARKTLDKFGSRYYETVSSNGGKMLRAHPAVGVVRDADRRLRGWLAEFGLTPAQRSGIVTLLDEDPADDAAGEFLD